MDWCMAVFWVIFGVIAFFYSADLLKPGIGRAILSSLWSSGLITPFYKSFPILQQMHGFGFSPQ
jgi:hypothetical protein